MMKDLEVLSCVITTVRRYVFMPEDALLFLSLFHSYADAQEQRPAKKPAEDICAQNRPWILSTLGVFTENRDV